MPPLADPRPPRDGLGPLVDQLREFKRQLRELEKPSGTQHANVVGSMVAFGSVSHAASGLSVVVPAAEAAVVSGTIVVPDGYTQASVTAHASVGAMNGSAVADTLTIGCAVNGATLARMPVAAAAHGYGSLLVSGSTELDGLTAGGVITVAATCWAPAGWGSDSLNVANIDCVALFRR